MSRARKWLNLPLARLAAVVCLPSLLVAVEVKVPVDTDYYRMKSLSIEEARDTAQPFLSPEGMLDNKQNILIIKDYPENIAKIKELLQEIDGTPANIRIEITFDSATTRNSLQAGVEDGEIRVTGKHRGRPRVVNGHIVAGATAGSREESSMTRQFILAGNNRPAQIWVGETVADPVWVFDYGVTHGWWRQELVWKNLGASLWVRPRLLPSGSIELEVYPRLTARGRGETVVDVKELSTRVIVADGRPMPLGGLDEERRQAYRQLFGLGQVFTGSRLGITLSASVMELPAEMRKPEKEDSPQRTQSK